jgi:hypothetical protein
LFDYGAGVVRVERICKHNDLFDPFCIAQPNHCCADGSGAAMSYPVITGSEAAGTFAMPFENDFHVFGAGVPFIVVQRFGRSGKVRSVPLIQLATEDDGFEFAAMPVSC